MLIVSLLVVLYYICREAGVDKRRSRLHNILLENKHKLYIDRGGEVCLNTSHPETLRNIEKQIDLIKDT